MSNLWVNIRFGTRHLQIGRGTFRIRTNQHHVENKPEKWLEVYEFFGYGSVVR